tara:strand:- start:474 stop:695 length:222 start_codon:yes stop_codon:yes gene_type:complete
MLCAGRLNRPQNGIYHYKVLYTVRGVTDEILCITSKDVFEKCGIKKSTLHNMLNGRIVKMHKDYTVERISQKV